ncbi:MAG: pyridoxal phosphate-dependent aminotransferase [Thermoguttaceae bacterium]|nr:pyridoxal phosphate-dependent aminotransferase [Thermoguttaceae bacterium]
MPEMNLNFDAMVDRRGTDCLKFDHAKRRGKPEGLLSFWVADMDFKISSYIQDAIRETVERGIYGYTEPTERYFEAVFNWMKARHGFEPREETLVKTPGVVFALAHCVRAFTRPGDAVLIQQPVYYPFSEVVLDNGRRLVSSDLARDENGVYHIDFDDFERKIVDNNVKLFLLCSPHNPVGRVWTREELARLGDVCLSHGVVVASDEIHEDFVFSGKHTVMETISSELAANTITCTSASKTFNIAGLQTSNIFISNPRLRDAFCHEVAASGFSQLNTVGLAATRAAYEHGGEWYEAALQYIKENLDYAVNYVNNEIPYASTARNEGTYLLWVSLRDSGWSDEELERLVVEDAKLWLDGGRMFGESGRGFQRINLACSRAYLALGLKRLREAIVDASVIKNRV